MEYDRITCNQSNGTQELLELCTSSCFPDSTHECVKDLDMNTILPCVDDLVSWAVCICAKFIENCDI